MDRTYHQQQQQPYLNGAYSNVYYRGSNCDCFYDCLTAFFVLIVVLFVFVILFLDVNILWPFAGPTMHKLHVTDASLSQFDLSNTLSYNLSLNMTLQNPNKHTEHFYNPTQVRAYYNGVKFAEKEFTAIYPHDKEEDHMNWELVGQYLIPLQYKDILCQNNSEKRSGIYIIDLKVDTYIWLRLGRIMKDLVAETFKCHLKVPSVFNGSASSSFVTTKCQS